MIDNYIIEHPSYQYALSVVNEDIIAGKYIKKECQRFIDELNNEDSEFFLDVDTMEMIDDLTGLFNMADGMNIGVSVKESLADFQWYFVVNALCWKYRDNPEKRRYEKSTLLIARKSGN